jgi:acyl carrier protein
MHPKEMDSLDIVEAVMVIEEIFGTDIPDRDAERLGTAEEIVDWLESQLSNQRPNEQANARLRKLSKAKNSPELAEGLEGTWRREQIAAVVRDIFRQ